MGRRGSRGCFWSAFSLPSVFTHLLELLDLSLIKHGEDIGASTLCRCPSPGLLGCLGGEGWAKGSMDPSVLSGGSGLDLGFFEFILLKELFWIEASLSL